MTEQGHQPGLWPVPGDGVLARQGNLILLCGLDDYNLADTLLDLLVTIASGGDDGRRFTDAIADALDNAMTSVAGDPADSSAVAFGPAGNGLAVTVSGGAWAELRGTHGGKQRLEATGPGMLLRAVLRSPVQLVRAGLAVGSSMQASTDRFSRLDGGTVRAGGLAWYPAFLPEPGRAAKPEPAPGPARAGQASAGPGGGAAAGLMPAGLQPGGPLPARPGPDEPEGGAAGVLAGAAAGALGGAAASAAASALAGPETDRSEAEPEQQLAPPDGGAKPAAEPEPGAGAEPGAQLAPSRPGAGFQPGTEVEPGGAFQPGAEAQPAAPSRRGAAARRREAERAAASEPAVPPGPPGDLAADLQGAGTEPPAEPAAGYAAAAAEPANQQAEAAGGLAALGFSAPPAAPPDPRQSFDAVLLIGAPPGGAVEVEPRTPLPGAAEVLRDPTIVSSGPIIQGVYCKNGHFNDPEARYCGVCGISMNQQTLVPRPGPRPPLGVLVMDDGAVFQLDHDYVVGREPTLDASVAGGGSRPLRIRDDAGIVSRVHAQLHLDGWRVLLTDLGSANGTRLLLPGEHAEISLQPQVPVVLVPGCQVDLGGRGFRYESHRGR
jgi:FHA domain